MFAVGMLTLFGACTGPEFNDVKEQQNLPSEIPLGVPLEVKFGHGPKREPSLPAEVFGSITLVGHNP